MGAGTATAVCTFILAAIALAVPIAMLCMGALHKEECPMEPYIPIFMIVSGAAGIISGLLSMCFYGGQVARSDGLVKCAGVTIVIMMFFTFAWSIAGSVWVFSKWSSWDDVKKTKNGCHNDLYLFAFASLIIFWVTLPCFIAGMCKSRQMTTV